MIVNLKLIEPCNENRQVGRTMPERQPNAEMRSREYLTPAEMLMAAKDGRLGPGDYKRIAASCKVHLVRPTCFMYVAKS